MWQIPPGPAIFYSFVFEALARLPGCGCAEIAARAGTSDTAPNADPST